VELNFTEEQERQLAPIALRQGKAGQSDLLKDAALRLLDDDARFETILGG
jgi:hypothetical protein